MWIDDKSLNRSLNDLSPSLLLPKCLHIICIFLEYWFFNEENHQPRLLPLNLNSIQWCNFFLILRTENWAISFLSFSFNLFYSVSCLLSLSPSVSALQLSPCSNVNEPLSLKLMMVLVLSFISSLIRDPNVADIYTICPNFHAGHTDQNNIQWDFSWLNLLPYWLVGYHYPMD